MDNNRQDGKIDKDIHGQDGIANTVCLIEAEVDDLTSQNTERQAYGYCRYYCRYHYYYYYHHHYYFASWFICSSSSTSKSLLYVTFRHKLSF